MDEEWMHRTSIELSKINFLLENMYAVSLRDHGAGPEDVDDLSDEMCRQALLPATIYGADQGPEHLQQFQELLGHRLAMFFAGVRKRLESAEEAD